MPADSCCCTAVELISWQKPDNWWPIRLTTGKLVTFRIEALKCSFEEVYGRQVSLGPGWRGDGGMISLLVRMNPAVL